MPSNNHKLQLQLLKVHTMSNKNFNVTESICFLWWTRLLLFSATLLVRAPTQISGRHFSYYLVSSSQRCVLGEQLKMACQPHIKMLSFPSKVLWQLHAQNAPIKLQSPGNIFHNCVWRLKAVLFQNIPKEKFIYGTGITSRFFSSSNQTFDIFMNGID